MIINILRYLARCPRLLKPFFHPLCVPLSLRWQDCQSSSSSSPSQCHSAIIIIIIFITIIVIVSSIVNYCHRYDQSTTIHSIIKYMMIIIIIILSYIWSSLSSSSNSANPVAGRPLDHLRRDRGLPSCLPGSRLIRKKKCGLHQYGNMAIILGHFEEKEICINMVTWH